MVWLKVHEQFGINLRYKFVIIFVDLLTLNIIGSSFDMQIVHM